MADKKRYGIDVSRWQGADFNFTKAKSEGVEFAIIKAGGGDDGLYQDRCWESNFKKAEAAGLFIGAYFFSHAMSVEEARKEANFFLTLLKGKKLSYPVFMDVEGDMVRRLNRIELTNVVNEFCSIVEAAGYWVGIYSSLSAFNTEMVDQSLLRYTHWIACWGPKTPPKAKSGAETQVWQESSSRIVAGRRTDTDYSYVDFPKWIKSKGLNNFDKPKKTTKKKGE